MNPQRLVGIVLLTIGVILLVMGINATGSLAEQASETFTGSYSDKTTWYIVGGIVAALVGLFLALMPQRRHAG